MVKTQRNTNNPTSGQRKKRGKFKKKGLSILNNVQYQLCARERAFSRAAKLNTMVYLKALSNIICILLVCCT